MAVNQNVVKIFQYFTGIELDNNFVKERQIVFNPERVPKDHYSRYKFAANKIESDDIVLDCACTCGYGTSMLAENAKKVIGVDINQYVIDFAKKIYGSDKTEFYCQDAQELKLDYKFNKIVSFETLEHIPNPELFLEKARTMMAPNGILICSVPNETVLPYKNSENHFHYRHYTDQEFIELIEKAGFKVENIYHQYWDDERTITEKQEDNNTDKALVIIARNISNN